LALLSFLPSRLKGAVVINTLPHIMLHGVAHKGEMVHPGTSKINLSPPKVIGENLMTLNGWDEVLFEKPELILPFWNSKAPILFVAGSDDRICMAVKQAEEAIRAAKAKSKENCQMLAYPGMGHLVDLPYVPIKTHDKHPLTPKGWDMFYGGDDKVKHCSGVEDQWTRVKHFLKSL